MLDRWSCLLHPQHRLERTGQPGAESGQLSVRRRVQIDEVQLRLRPLGFGKMKGVGPGGREEAERLAAVVVAMDDGIGRVCFAWKSQGVPEGNPRPGAAVGIPEGERNPAGPAFPRAGTTGQVLGHGPLEVPHEERVDDGVHGAVAVAQPGQEVEKILRNAIADRLEKARRRKAIEGEARKRRKTEREGLPKLAFLQNAGRPRRTTTTEGQICAAKRDSR